MVVFTTNTNWKGLRRENYLAQHQVGFHFCARHPVQAYMWLELAAAQGGEFYQSQRNEAGRQMTPDQIAQAKALAAAWKPKVAAVPGVKAKD